MRSPSSRRSLQSILLAFLLVVGVSAVALFQEDAHPREDHVTSVAASGAEHTVTLRNETDGVIWVGSVASADGSSPLTGLPTLERGQSTTLTIPERAGAGHWRGTFFARQGCTGEPGSTFHCAVGDCGPYADRCVTGEQPVSLAEFNFDTADAAAPWYDVSYVNAVNVPVTITPEGVSPPADGGECAEMGCPGALLAACPPDNLVRESGTNKPLVCVNPNRDAKTAYSDAITQQCPKAYAWSKHDAEAGNQVMRQCSHCSGLTVTFHAGDPSEQDSTAPDKAHPDNPGEGGAHRSGASLTAQKGVALNLSGNASQALTDSGASWFHNWASSSGNLAKPGNVEFVPMIWGPDSVTDAELANATREGRNLLAFNEPDHPGQADMTVEQALDLWPRLEGTGLRLGAPAVSADADKPGSWLDRFMMGASERGLRVDFIPVHWYGADFSSDATQQLVDYLRRVHDRYKKPVWLTEYALIDFTGGTPRYPNEEEQSNFIRKSMQGLKALDFVEKYAWFALSTETSPTGLYAGTNATDSGRVYRETS
ncbi:glycosyl hydrolase [Streptomyces sp. CoH17]|uniref:glycosyl hydrolase n=1 Tax=Streptomyces sp. CoH17 TaxID=2992806 RepID=UPI0022709808|nr:glycosyl hydrolase [Streptomyces sp. CoH17]